ncbi:hypothetical protein [Longimicrobium terrae]|uniref:ABC transporter permease n=1 Tax=Longimicrobium terrae TaxID=1639882 RepID=A0A841H638_9BACT|nr:hypothetical protein [Longimicrobium terrae]MBB4639318.1 hypothetical protein [Longimicrobium terrae]MBB6073611.1 hypothetical protein [Longimicrobium terrae]NNC29382.1 hypothetical protein [Longimicrobium terrae]
MTTAALPGRRSTGALVYLIATQLISLASLLPWIVVASFLEGAQSEPLWIKLIMAAVIAYPLLPIGCAVMAWIAWRRGRTRAAVLWTTAPLAIVIPILLFGLTFGAGVELTGVSASGWRTVRVG